MNDEREETIGRSGRMSLIMKEAIIEYNDPMEGAKRIDKFGECCVTINENLINVEEDDAITAYKVDNIIKITAKKREDDKWDIS